MSDPWTRRHIRPRSTSAPLPDVQNRFYRSAGLACIVLFLTVPFVMAFSVISVLLIWNRTQEARSGVLCGGAGPFRLRMFAWFMAHCGNSTDRYLAPYKSRLFSRLSGTVLESRVCLDRNRRICGSPSGCAATHRWNGFQVPVCGVGRALTLSRAGPPTHVLWRSPGTPLTFPCGVQALSAPHRPKRTLPSKSFGCGYFGTTAKCTEKQRVSGIQPGFGDGLSRGYQNNPGLCFNPGVGTLPVWLGDAGWFSRVCRGGSVGFSTGGIAGPPCGIAEPLLGRV
jgi:hypothetical protein